ncbi:polysaccharide pyruvyl transferase CsaB [uncultured Fretibacterium sp.]|uniref:polysaccharide pyruvyl transferase CsaB n=1 Tax=uncultured Fretibacterium sp. TaxID=1678694 RepID=UPI00325FC3AC
MTPQGGARRYRVALAGYYGFGNLGDELLAGASLEALERAGVGRGSVVMLSNDPEGSRRAFGVDSVSRWRLRGVVSALRSSETLLLGGGGLFQDGTSLRSCLWYWGLVRLALICGAVPWALGQSIGPLRSAGARWLTRDALRACRVLHLRDAPSMEWADRLGLSAVRGGDLALTLKIPRAAGEDAGRTEEKTGRLLLNLRPSPDADRFARLAAPLAADFPGEVVGVALSGEDEILLGAMKGAGRLRLDRVERVAGLEEAARLWPGASAAVGMRLHFAVLSALWGTPLAVLPYDPKVEAFARGVGVPCAGEELPQPCPPAPLDRLGVVLELDALCRAFLSKG